MLAWQEAPTMEPAPIVPGQLRIYLGFAPGVGTTCTMLDEGRRRAEQGSDVVVGCAETHGRPHTAGLLAGLEVIPPAAIPCQGATAEEMDLGAVLARRPQVALVDDLAHSNWFRIANLSMLRELALLWLAAKLASDPRRPPGGHDPGSSHAWERVVVALSGGPEGDTLIRRAARIAARCGGDLLAVHVAAPGGPAGARRGALAAQRLLVESLGGTYRQLVGADIPAALLAFAHLENATQLVLGKHGHTRLAALRPRAAVGSQ